jgi:DNA (cytosine-5)-methyltransferase 1
MLDGQVYELVMPEHHTSDSESLLLRTPVASEVEGGAVAPAVAKAKGQTLRLSGQIIDMVAPNQLPKLPTPTVSDQYTANLASTQQKPGSMHSVTLAQVFHKPELFPTPVASDMNDRRASPNWKGNDLVSTVKRDLLGTPRANAAESSSKQVELGAPKSRIEDQVLATNWGKFEPAIRRWETILGRPAPEPTKPDGKDNNHRLSSKFTEWMMGLPDGWITGHDLKRNDELKLAGNGVVPQQAELALRLLLELPEGEQ